VTTAELLQNRDTRLVWVEPWTGIGPAGNKWTIAVENSVAVKDAIDLMRYDYCKGDSAVLRRFPPSDEDLLLDFMAVYWATPQGELDSSHTPA